MKILILDDDQDRHRWFRASLAGCERYHVRTVDAALALLNKESPFDCVYLDCDLDISQSLGLASETDSGRVVAEYIGSHLRRDLLPKKVVIHSENDEGAEEMWKLMKWLPIPIEMNPFHQLKRGQSGEIRGWIHAKSDSR